MSLKIFYSWQNDTEGKYNRNFIKDCLERAIKELNKAFDLEEPIRLDHDTKDVLGTPDIVNTILKKIEESDVFVGDLTFISKSGNGRYCPNPNVLIELGYALKCIKDTRVINVVNIAFGEVKNNLPFDLEHKRWPLQYNLSDKNYAEKAKVRDELVKKIKSALQPYLFIEKEKQGPVFKTPADLILHREKLRKEFEQEILTNRSKELRSDVIIRDVDRVDSYPDIDETEKGISPWFRVALLDTYKRGARIGLRIGNLTECENGYRYTDYKAGEKGDIRAFLIGEIPYESIVAVNWDGDEFYYFPHIYCHFNHNGEPYERLVYCREIEMGNGHKHYSDIAEYESVKLNSDSFGVEYFA